MIATTALAPWLLGPLQQALDQVRGHALLVHGQPGVGQFDFGLALASAWLCEAQDGQGAPLKPACGRCTACHLIQARAHPDLMVLLPEALEAALGWSAASDDDGKSEPAGKGRKPSQEIKVEAVRRAVAFSQHTSSRGRAKVILIHPAGRMNTVSSNTLLKTLEEPPGAVRFILSAVGSVDGILPTIRSRCQMWHLALPDAEPAVRWLCAQAEGLSEGDAALLLAAAGGEPGTALDRLTQGLTASGWRGLPALVAQGQAGAMAQWPLPLVIETLQKLCLDLSAVSVGGQPHYFEAASLPAPPPLARLLAWHKQLQQVARHAEHPWHATLRLESLLDQAALALRRRAA